MGQQAPEVLADVRTTQHFSGGGPRVILCHAFSVHLISHFKYRGAKGMTHYVCSLMLRYCVDYIRSECVIICYYFPCMNRELFIRAWTNALLQRICCCSVNDALHGKSMWPIMCTWIWSDRTFEQGHFIIL